MFHQQNTLVVAALCPISLLMEHLSGIFLPLRELSPFSNNGDYGQYLAKGGTTVDGDLKQLKSG